MALVPVYMPKFGMTMTEGFITEWHVEEGAVVHQGELLFSVETEKATSDVEALASGTIAEICAEAESDVPVGGIVAYIETDSEVS
ncbi:MAG: biotin attachment protein [Roseiflexaceae bacterium]|nr:biotin attachment protein [Roseiflexaceae bacterium]